MTQRPISQKNQEIIKQVEATMRIENMPLTRQAKQNLIDMASGKKTFKQIQEEIKRRYTQV
ncbi:MAG: hypothetical protein ACLRT4_05850 [Thomasclavelia sp.]